MTFPVKKNRNSLLPLWALWNYLACMQCDSGIYGCHLTPALPHQWCLRRSTRGIASCAVHTDRIMWTPGYTFVSVMQVCVSRPEVKGKKKERRKEQRPGYIYAVRSKVYKYKCFFFRLLHRKSYFGSSPCPEMYKCVLNTPCPEWNPRWCSYKCAYHVHTGKFPTWPMSNNPCGQGDPGLLLLCTSTSDV